MSRGEQVVDELIADAKLRSEVPEVLSKQDKGVSIGELYEDLIRDLRGMGSRFHQQPEEFVFSEADAAVASKAADMLEFMLKMMGMTEERHQYEMAGLEDRHRREDLSHIDVREPSLNWGP